MGAIIAMLSNHIKRPFLAALITLCFSCSLMLFYLGGELRGNIDWSILPSAQYEAPDAVSETGLKPLYIKTGQSGWDGQFYYYIANDILAQTDAKHKVEMAPYRYQRVGIPLIAKVASTLLGYDYVPVIIFYAVSLLLVVSATFVFAFFLQKVGVSPYLSLLWSLAAGTQMTILNGLPDAGADALLLMSLVAFFLKRFWLYAISISLCVLSREVYILFPVSLALVTLWEHKRVLFTRLMALRFLVMGLPILVWSGWQIYLKLHFSDIPSVNVFKEGLVGFPLASWSYHTVNALVGQHPIFRAFPLSYLEPLSLLSFFALLMLSFGGAFSFFRNRHSDKKSLIQANLFGVMIGFVLLFVIYLFFGDTVMRHHTGFLKTVSICYVSIILSSVIYKGYVNKTVLILMIVCFLIPQATLFLRVTSPPSSLLSYTGVYTKALAMNTQENLRCVDNISYEINLVKKVPFSQNPALSYFSGQDNSYILYVNVKNTSQTPWVAATSGHIIWLGYHWFRKADGQHITESLWPSILQETMAPNEERVIPIIVSVPDQTVPKILHFSVFQDGCRSSQKLGGNASSQINWN